MAFIENRSGGVLRRLTLAALGAALLAGLHGVPTAAAFSSVPVEQLTVPSSAMGRDIRVEFLDGGEGAHALYLLDSMEAGDDFNGWDINTAAFDWYKDSGISVVMPVGGKSSFYSDWYGPADGQRRDLYLQMGDVPDPGTARVSRHQQERAVDRQRHRGVLDGWFVSAGAGRLPSAAVHLRRIAVGLPQSLGAQPAGQVGIAMMWNGGFNPEAMWGPPGDPAWARNDPTVQAGRLAANGTRLWIYCGNGTPTDPALASPDAPIGGLGLPRGIGDRLQPRLRRRLHRRRRQQRDVQLPRRHPQLGLFGPAAAADEAGHAAGARRHACRVNYDNRSRSERFSTLP